MAPHPLQHLSVTETNRAKDIVLAQHPGAVLVFRNIFLQEPPKADLIAFLDLEHSGQLTESTKRPKRLALCQYDVIQDKIPVYQESTVDLISHEIILQETFGKQHHANLVMCDPRPQRENYEGMLLTIVQLRVRNAR